MTEQEIENIKNKIDGAKKDEANYEGRLQEIMKRLKDEFGLTSVEEVQKMLTDMEKELNVLKGKAEKQLEQLQENYEW